MWSERRRGSADPAAVASRRSGPGGPRLSVALRARRPAAVALPAFGRPSLFEPEPWASSPRPPDFCGPFWASSLHLCPLLCSESRRLRLWVPSHPCLSSLPPSLLWCPQSLDPLCPGSPWRASPLTPASSSLSSSPYPCPPSLRSLSPSPSSLSPTCLHLPPQYYSSPTPFSPCYLTFSAHAFNACLPKPLLSRFPAEALFFCFFVFAPLSGFLSSQPCPLHSCHPPPLPSQFLASASGRSIKLQTLLCFPMTHR